MHEPQEVLRILGQRHVRDLGDYRQHLIAAVCVGWPPKAMAAGIGSIKTYHRLGIGCLSECSNQPQDDAVEVHLYTGSGGSGTLVGKVLYVHVEDILVSDGGTYNVSGYVSIGWVPADACGSCYTGAHTHVQSDSGASLVSGLTDCGDGIACCGTNQYQW